MLCSLRSRRTSDSLEASIRRKKPGSLSDPRVRRDRRNAMTKLDFWLSLMVIVALIILALIFIPAPAHCVWCPTYKCYGPCGCTCVCISRPGEGHGFCYGIEYKDFFLSRGYK